MCDLPSKKARVRVHTNTDDPGVIAKAIIGIARSYGVEDAVFKSLSPKEYTQMIVPDRAMRDLLKWMREQYGKHSGVLFRNITKWLDIKLGLVEKAAAGGGRHLTPDDIEELRNIVRAHFSGEGIGEDMLRLFDDYGMTPTDFQFMITAYQDAFLSGKVSPDMDAALDELRVEMARAPRTRIDQLALERGQANLRGYLRKLGETAAQDIGHVVSAHEARQVSGLINSFLGGNLRQTAQSDTGLGQLTAEEQDALRHDRWVESERQLRSEMYHYFKDDPQNRDRDWWRVAVTETRAANNTARLVNSLDDFDEIYFHVQADACIECKTAYLNEDGTPRVFPVRDVAMRAIETHGVNMAATRGMPNATMHPHCNCIPTPYVPGSVPPRHPSPRSKRRRR